MSDEVRSFPLRHISIRVPWHDSGWNGTVCKDPKLNGACLRLSRIAEHKKDDKEEQIAGKSIADLNEQDWPCCIPERAMFMSPFPYTRTATHPYINTQKKTHGYFDATPLYHPPYSVPAVPFRWMREELMGEYRDKYLLDIDESREPEFDDGFVTDWVQALENQKALLDCFFEHVKPSKSLCFFYAKEIPLINDPNRIIIGVGRVNDVGDGTEYKYKHINKKGLRSMLWERAIQHSIRPDFSDGFLLPYSDLFDYCEKHTELDPNKFVAFAPEDKWSEFSYAAEHVSHDGAIASLLSCSKALMEIKNHIGGSFDGQLIWINDRLSELWNMRGPYPGLGSALTAFGFPQGVLIAHELEKKVKDDADVWDLIDSMIMSPRLFLPENLVYTIGSTIFQTWRSLKPERKTLLKLISRFDISADQAKSIFVKVERERNAVGCTDKELIENPYLFYELTRFTNDPISVWEIDRGMFPKSVIGSSNELPEPSALTDEYDPRRIRALTVKQLENAATEEGHSLLPQSEIIKRLRDLEIAPKCEITEDILPVAEEYFPDSIKSFQMENDETGYQLKRLDNIGRIIRKTVNRLLNQDRHEIEDTWVKLLGEILPPLPDNDKSEIRARNEKVEALKEIAASRISVLIGSAGSGKTTLLAALCKHKEIESGNVLLLAPTGKARVRIDQINKVAGTFFKAQTIAQFLFKHGRYDGETNHYHLSDQSPVNPAETVIIDESSMITEEMLGALLQSLSGIQRLILVGDPHQLPPIGTGRPFVDIISKLKPYNRDSIFPKIGIGYAELTQTRRQLGEARYDRQLAKWFSGLSIDPGDDDIWHKVNQDFESSTIRFKRWDNPNELSPLLLGILTEELNLADDRDVKGFDISLGGVKNKDYIDFKLGAARSVEGWQILSPVRTRQQGVNNINRMLHSHFRSSKINFASMKKYNVTGPMGSEMVVFGDKVLNTRNQSRYVVDYRKGEENYVANGEIGIVTGPFTKGRYKSSTGSLHVEFSTQCGKEYIFTGNDFSDEAYPVLELAYALTVHKAQGSEFDIVILVIPNPCRLLSRELIYTALTRQRKKIIVLHQGEFSDLKEYSSDSKSLIANRYTNLFQDPQIVQVKDKFYAEFLIHRTEKNELARSKSEVIIANMLKHNDIDYEFELTRTFGGVTRYPDFTIEDDEGKLYFWEHCGMMSDPGYRTRWEMKEAWYREHGVIPYQEGGGSYGTLIVTYDDEKGGISSPEIKRVIDTVILQRKTD